MVLFSLQSRVHLRRRKIQWRKQVFLHLPRARMVNSQVSFIHLPPPTSLHLLVPSSSSSSSSSYHLSLRFSLYFHDLYLFFISLFIYLFIHIYTIILHKSPPRQVNLALPGFLLLVVLNLLLTFI